MKHGDFRIGQDFEMSGKRWRCTDVGTRVVVAVELTAEVADYEEVWLAGGPPYAVAEVVIDENDMPACSTDKLSTVEPTPPDPHVPTFWAGDPDLQAKASALREACFALREPVCQRFMGMPMTEQTRTQIGLWATATLYETLPWARHHVELIAQTSEGPTTMWLGPVARSQWDLQVIAVARHQEKEAGGG